jgi:hypothetical protein
MEVVVELTEIWVAVALLLPPLPQSSMGLVVAVDFILPLG